MIDFLKKESMEDKDPYNNLEMALKSTLKKDFDDSDIEFLYWERLLPKFSTFDGDICKFVVQNGESFTGIIRGDIMQDTNGDFFEFEEREINFEPPEKAWQNDKRIKMRLRNLVEISIVKKGNERLSDQELDLEEKRLMNKSLT